MFLLVSTWVGDLLSALLPKIDMKKVLDTRKKKERYEGLKDVETHKKLFQVVFGIYSRCTKQLAGTTKMVFLSFPAQNSRFLGNFKNQIY